MFVFDNITVMSNSTGYLKSDVAYMKMRMSSYNYFTTADVFRILVKAETIKFYKNFDIFEYMINDPPYTKSLIIKSNDKYHNYTMRTIFNITTINKTINSTLQGWYD